MKTMYRFSIPGTGRDAISLAFSAVQWFMREKTLNTPECTIFYTDNSMKTFNADAFLVGAGTRYKLGQSIGFTAVAGLTEDDVDRVTLSYIDKNDFVMINFPNMKTVSPEGIQLIDRFRKELSLQEIGN